MFCWLTYILVNPFIAILLAFAFVWVVVRLVMSHPGSIAPALGPPAALRGRCQGRSRDPRTGPWVQGLCTCHDCRHVNPPHARYCGRCGRRLAW